MPEGGKLTISGEAVDGDVAVAIADTGVGIPRESLERILEPLYSTKARGIGLGLAITRSIIEKHGGQLQVASDPVREADLPSGCRPPATDARREPRGMKNGGRSTSPAGRR